jgi:DNA polymerase-3 subunit delta'
VSEEAATSAASLAQGNVAEAIELLQGADAQHAFFDLFVKMMRAAYKANPMDLMEVSEDAAALDKENQKNFLKYGLHIFRESIILNYMKGELVNLQSNERAFLEKFARFIHYHLERNANPKILFSDVVIKLTKLIKKGV